MLEERRKVGLLRSVGRTPIGSLLWPEGIVALMLGIGGGVALLQSTTIAQRVRTAGDGINLLGFLLGVVFAAFALLIALFSDDYVKLLERAEGGIIVFLRPFMIAIGSEVTTLFLGIAYRAVASDLDSRIEHVVFVVWLFLFAFSLADVVALTRNVMLHGLTRARQLRPPEDDPKVRALHENKSG